MKQILTLLFIGFTALTSKSQCTYTIDTTNLLKIEFDTNFTVSDSGKNVWVCEGIVSNIDISAPCSIYFERECFCTLSGSAYGLNIYAKHGSYIDNLALMGYTNMVVQETGANVTYFGLTNINCDTLTYDYSLVGPFIPCMSFDFDADGVADSLDNCYKTVNPGQDDADIDGLGDDCDNCPGLSNVGQDDNDADGIGNLCDNCIYEYNPGQADADGDGIGDSCEPFGITEINGNRFYLAPNPANDFVSVISNYAFNNANIKLLDLSGKLIREYNNLCGLNLKVDISMVSGGMYYLLINEGSNSAATKLVKH